MIDKISFKKYLLDKDDKTTVKGLSYTNYSQAEIDSLIERHNKEFIERYNDFKVKGLSDEEIKNILDQEIQNNYQQITSCVDSKNIAISNKLQQKFDFYRNNYPIINYGTDHYSDRDLGSKKNQIADDLYINIVKPEIEEIMKEQGTFKNRVPARAIKLVEQFSTNPNLASMLWNDRYSHYRYYKEKLYYIELRSGALGPNLFFNEYSIENFCKGVDNFCKWSSWELKDCERKIKMQRKLLTCVITMVVLLIFYFSLK